MIKSQRLGVAEGIDYHSLNYDDMKSTILKVLEEPSYAANIKKVSARFKDQKEKPLDRAIFWIEWIIRNPDCDYLKSPVLELGYIVGNSYDIIAFIVLLIILILIIFLYLLSFCIGKCSSKTHSKEELLHKKDE